jgi:hypothetical protein
MQNDSLKGFIIRFLIVTCNISSTFGTCFT